MSEGPEYKDPGPEPDDLEAELVHGMASAEMLAEHVLKMGANRVSFPVAIGDSRFTVLVTKHD